MKQQKMFVLSIIILAVALIVFAAACTNIQDSSTITYMADGKEIRMRESMRNIIDALTKEGFAMASTTLLIHLSHVDSFQENCVLMGKRSFYIGRKYRKEFFHALSTYLSEGRR